MRFRQTHTYDHSPEAVWRALTDRRAISTWLMATDDYEPVVGRLFTLTTDPAPGFDGIVRCEVLELEPPHVQRWRWSGGPIDTVVTFILEPHGSGGCELTVEQSGFEGVRGALIRLLLGRGAKDIYGRRLPAFLDGREDAAGVKHFAWRKREW